MLPDLPVLKSDLQKLLDKYLYAQVQLRMGVFGESPRYLIHEGEGATRIIRADGSIQDSDLREASAEMNINLGDVASMTGAERIAQLDIMADDMARQMSQHLFATLNETLDRAGQVVDRGGRPFDVEAVFDVLRTIEINFDDDGQHSNLSVVVHPDMHAMLREAFDRIDTEPVLRARYDELMKIKKAEWRDRESARKLVG